MIKHFGKKAQKKKKGSGMKLYESEFYDMSVEAEPKPIVLGKESENFFFMSDKEGTHFWDMRLEEKVWSMKEKKVSRRGLDIGDFLLNISETDKENALSL